MAHKCTINLAAFGKTIEDATAFYIEHLKAVKKREESLTIDRLATEWFAGKKAGKQKSLRKDTLESIEETARTLRKQFGSKRILEVTDEALVAYLDSIKAATEEDSMSKASSRNSLIGAGLVSISRKTRLTFTRSQFPKGSRRFCLFRPVNDSLN